MPAHIVTAALFAPANTRSHLASAGDPIFSNEEHYPHLSPFPYTSTRSSAGGGGGSEADSSGKKGKAAEDMIIVVADGAFSLLSTVSEICELSSSSCRILQLKRERFQSFEIHESHHYTLRLQALPIQQPVQSSDTTIMYQPPRSVMTNRRDTVERVNPLISKTSLASPSVLSVYLFVTIAHSPFWTTLVVLYLFLFEYPF